MRNESKLVINTPQNVKREALENLLAKVRKRLAENGTAEESINILTKESIPLAYPTGAAKLKVKLCGDLVIFKMTIPGTP